METGQWNVELHVRLAAKAVAVENLGACALEIKAPTPFGNQRDVIVTPTSPSKSVKRLYLRLDHARSFALCIESTPTGLTLPCYMVWAGKECEASLVLKP